MKLWSLSPLNKQKISQLQNEYELPAMVAAMLQLRGITEREKVESFLFNESKIDSPFEIKDMDRAVERINKAVENDELICVYGDFDVDGVTSTAILYSYLEAIAANAMFYIPSREAEGYGMNTGAVDFLHEKGVKLIVTVDNGVSAVSEIAYANSLGIDTVVTDHHMPQAELPPAYAVVDPHREDCKSRFKNLCGAGVAFKLVVALEGEYGDFDSLYENYSDLLCIATIADVVELKDENRAFVKHGIETLKNCDRVGINKLIEQANIDKSNLSVYDISFKIAPRINSIGRLGRCDNAVKLLLTDDESEAEEIASFMCDENVERRQIESDELIEIDKMIEKTPAVVASRVIVVDGSNWREGVNGLVAARLKEAYGKPTVVISRHNGKAKGSARSVEGFPIHKAIEYCSDLLGHFGGHPMAAGLSLDEDNIELFRKRINEFANNFEYFPFDSINISCKLNPLGISVDLIKTIDYLKPFGAGNPTPIFGLYNMTIEDIVPLSNNKHLRIQLKKNGTEIRAMQFGMSTTAFPYNKGDVVDVAVKLSINEYNGNSYPSVNIQAIKFSDDNTEEILQSERIFEDFCSGIRLSEQQLLSILPERSDFIHLYKYLKKNGGYTYPTETLVHRLDNILSYGKIKVIIRALYELNLIKITEGLNRFEIALVQNPEKVDLESAPIIKQLRRKQSE